MPGSRTRLGLLAGGAALATAALAVGLYGIMAGGGNAQGGACQASAAVAARLGPLATGEVAAVQVAATPRPMNELSFKAPDGSDTKLSSFRGRTVLLNLWATWCAPCRHEMPALDRLQAELGGPDFEVVAINIDQRNPDKPLAFLKDIGVSRLAHYTDPSARVFQDLRAASRALGMPTTILIDREGCELALLHGPADWASADALRLLRSALGR
jgi:thiol-disulfide isomerase/thioredoxin